MFPMSEAIRTAQPEPAGSGPRPPEPAGSEPRPPEPAGSEPRPPEPAGSTADDFGWADVAFHGGLKAQAHGLDFGKLRHFSGPTAALLEDGVIKGRGARR